jgi:hypothetical protein
MTQKEIRPAANGTDHQLIFHAYTNSNGWCRCAQCGAVKQLADMAPDRRRKSGRRAVCRDCRSAYDRLRYSTNRDPMRAHQDKYRLANPGVGWAASYRRRAKRFGFTPVFQMLTREDIVARWGDHCVYCATGPFEQADHITPIAAEGHHLLFNVVPCCRKCNQWKRWASDDLVIRSYRAARASGAGESSTASPSRT